MEQGNDKQRQSGCCIFKYRKLRHRGISGSGLWQQAGGGGGRPGGAEPRRPAPAAASGRSDTAGAHAAAAIASADLLRMDSSWPASVWGVKRSTDVPQPRLPALPACLLQVPARPQAQGPGADQEAAQGQEGGPRRREARRGEFMAGRAAGAGWLLWRSPAACGSRLLAAPRPHACCSVHGLPICCRRCGRPRRRGGPWPVPPARQPAAGRAAMLRQHGAMQSCSEAAASARGRQQHGSRGHGRGSQTLAAAWLLMVAAADRLARRRRCGCIHVTSQAAAS